ncbi:hypothetical protein B0H16DRAFT_1825924 [Mycena metata]|uniref:Uncharacterized protein n=1 Tax=Mycena metata TaxID=1033252 RepID=A0AAD7J4F1_9AGAR|nr:hypothetical protein B0H16DRAFT_1825924 [Mycena metata]
MHFSLRIAAGTPLPPLIRVKLLLFFLQIPNSRQRNVLAASTGSLPDLRRLLNLMEQGHRQPALFLPAFYASLDPSGVPTATELDAMLATAASRISLNQLLVKTVISLTCVCTIRSISPEALLDLWPRAWAWISFVSSYRDVLPDFQEDPELQLRSIHRFMDSPEVASLVDATPGVRIVIGRVWVSLLNSPEGLDKLSDFGWEAATPLHHLVVNFIQRSTANPDFFNDLAGALAFVSCIASDNTIHALFLSHGIAKVLVQTILAMPESTSGIMPYVLILLRTQLHTTGGYLYLNQALRHGLLRAIFLFCVRAKPAGSRPPMDLEPLRSFLITILPTASVYYSFLVYLEKAFLEIEDDETTDKRIKDSPVREEWRNFVDFARECLAFKRTFDSFPITRKACDNVGCNVVAAKIEFWEGGHRDICSRIRTYSFANPRVGKRDRAFIRALINKDYAAHRGVILTSTIFAAAVGLEHDFYVEFTYPCGIPRADPQPFPNHAVDLPTDWEALLKHFHERALRSDGKMQVHTVKLFRADDYWTWLFPLRRSSAVFDEMRNLGRSFEINEDGFPINPGLADEIAQLECLDIEAFH